MYSYVGFSSTDKVERTLEMSSNCFRTSWHQHWSPSLRWRQCCTSDRLTWIGRSFQRSFQIFQGTLEDSDSQCQIVNFKLLRVQLQLLRMPRSKLWYAPAFAILAFLRFPSAKACDFLPDLVPSATAVKHLAARHPVGLPWTADHHDHRDHHDHLLDLEPWVIFWDFGKVLAART